MDGTVLSYERARQVKQIHLLGENKQFERGNAQYSVEHTLSQKKMKSSLGQYPEQFLIQEPVLFTRAQSIHDGLLPLVQPQAALFKSRKYWHPVPS